MYRIRGHCWRGSTCVYLHRPEDLEIELYDNNELEDEAIHEDEENHDDNQNHDGEENYDEKENTLDHFDNHIKGTIDDSTTTHEYRSITTDEILAMYESDNDEKIGPVKKSTKKKKNEKI